MTQAKTEPSTGKVTSPSEALIVAIGASAGGFQSLEFLLRALSDQFSCPVLVVQHLHPKHETLLDQLLSPMTNLRVKLAEDGEAIKSRVVYVAPPNRHLLVRSGCVELTDTKLVEWVRPSIDVLFGSVAACYGSGSIGVVLSGSLRDGAMGIRQIKMSGGVTFAEDPEKARFRSMPSAAIATGCVDFVLSAAEIGARLSQLTRRM